MCASLDAAAAFIGRRHGQLQLVTDGSDTTLYAGGIADEPLHCAARDWSCSAECARQ